MRRTDLAAPADNFRPAFGPILRKGEILSRA